MAPMRLHCFAQSGNAYRVALMLSLCDLPWEPVFVDGLHGATRTDAFRDGLNEMGEVPVLEDGGLKLTQSGVILHYLAEKAGRFMPDDAEGRREVLRWILFDNHKFTSYFAALRFIVELTGQGEGQGPVADFLRGRARSAFQVADAHLARRDFVVGNAPTIADLSMAGYVYYPERAGVPLSDFPNLSAWADRIRGLPGWAHPYDLMPGYSPAAAE